MFGQNALTFECLFLQTIDVDLWLVLYVLDWAGVMTAIGERTKASIEARRVSASRFYYA
jgi:hypothetical protein